MATSNFTSPLTATTSASLADLYKKTNTEVMEAIKAVTEEYDWMDDCPDEAIIPSANEMRLVLDVDYETGVAMIPEGGYEAAITTVAPQHGTLTPVQANARFSFTTLYEQGWNKAGKAGQIMNQLKFEAMKKTQALAETIGLQTYGFSTGTIAVVAATGSGGTTQTNIEVENAFGTSYVSGADAASAAYLNKLLRAGEGVALIRSGNLVEFGTYNGAGTSGNGYFDITFTSSITPTAGDLIVKANAVIDATITATDRNRWPVGLFDATTSASVHGLATSAAPNWASYQDTTGGRFTYAKQEKMLDEIWNNGGVKADRIIWSQGVRRDVIAGERAALRYESSVFDFDGKFGTSGIKYMTSRLAPAGTVFGYNRKVFTKKVLSEKPPMEGGPGLFAFDKRQDQGSVAGSLNFIYFRVVNNRAGMGVCVDLTEQ